VQPWVPDMQKSVGEERKGIGLYSHEQAKNTTAFQYLAQIVVGTIIASLGGLLLFHRMTVSSEEMIRKYGSAQTSIWGWVGSLAVVVIGMFMAHAGVIFYARRIVKRVFGSAHKSQSSNRHGPS